MNWISNEQYAPTDSLCKDIMGLQIKKTLRKSSSSVSGKAIPIGTTVVQLEPGRYARMTILEFITLVYEMTGDRFLNHEAAKLYCASKI